MSRAWPSHLGRAIALPRFPGTTGEPGLGAPWLLSTMPTPSSIPVLPSNQLLTFALSTLFLCAVCDTNAQPTLRKTQVFLALSTWSIPSRVKRLVSSVHG